MKQWKRIQAAILAGILGLTSVVPMQLSAGMLSLSAYAEESTENRCGENLTYELDASTGTLTIRGTGEMFKYGYEKSPFFLNTDIQNLVVEEGVTSLGDYAFQECTSLKTLQLPSTLEVIQNSAFEDCTALSSIHIPENVTTIGPWAFQNCSGIDCIYFPESLTSIQSNAFVSCTNLFHAHYAGTKEQWEAVSISSYGNTVIQNANIFYEEVPATTATTDYTVPVSTATTATTATVATSTTEPTPTEKDITMGINDIYVDMRDSQDESVSLSMYLDAPSGMGFYAISGVLCLPEETAELLRFEYEKDSCYCYFGNYDVVNQDALNQYQNFSDTEKEYCDESFRWIRYALTSVNSESTSGSLLDLYMYFEKSDVSQVAEKYGMTLETGTYMGETVSYYEFPVEWAPEGTDMLKSQGEKVPVKRYQMLDDTQMDIFSDRVQLKDGFVRVIVENGTETTTTTAQTTTTTTEATTAATKPTTSTHSSTTQTTTTTTTTATTATTQTTTTTAKPTTTTTAATTTATSKTTASTTTMTTTTTRESHTRQSYTTTTTRETYTKQSYTTTTTTTTTTTEATTTTTTETTTIPTTESTTSTTASSAETTTTTQESMIEWIADKSGDVHGKLWIENGIGYLHYYADGENKVLESLAISNLLATLTNNEPLLEKIKEISALYIDIDDVTSINSGALYCGDKNSQKWIYDILFSHVVEVDLSSSIISIGDRGFNGLSIETLVISNKLESIGAASFSKSEISQIELRSKDDEYRIEDYTMRSNMTYPDWHTARLTENVYQIADVEPIVWDEEVLNVVSSMQLKSVSVSAFIYNNFQYMLLPDALELLDNFSIGYISNRIKDGFTIYGWNGSAAKEYVNAQNKESEDNKRTERMIFIPVDGDSIDSLKGDVNRDGEINSMDVAYMLSYAARESAGLDTTFQDIIRNANFAEDSLFWAADVDDSGEINSRDAAYALSYVANLSVGNEISWSDVIR